MTEPSNGGSLRDTGVTKVVAGEVVGNKDPTGFTVQAKVFGDTFGILGFGTGEGKVDRETLERLLGNHCGVVAGRVFALFGLDTSRALVEDRIMMLKLGNTFDMLMGIVEVIITGVSKALVPKETFSGSANLVDRGSAGDDVMKGDTVLGNGHRMELFVKVTVFMFLVGKDILDSGTFTGGMEVRIRLKC